MPCPPAGIRPVGRIVYTSRMVPRSIRPIPAHPDARVASVDRAWSGRHTVDIVRFRHRRFDGTMSDTRDRELWRRGRAVALVPYDPSADAVVPIEQVGLPALAAGIAPVLVELPAGLMKDGEDPETAKRRELLEEAHLKCGRMERIGAYLLSAGSSDEVPDLNIGEIRLSPPGPDGTPGFAGAVDKGEDIRVSAWPADRAIDLALPGATPNGATPNGVTAIGLLWLAAKRDELRQRWSQP